MAQVVSDAQCVLQREEQGAVYFVLGLDMMSEMVLFVYFVMELERIDVQAVTHKVIEIAVSVKERANSIVVDAKDKECYVVINVKGKDR